MSMTKSAILIHGGQKYSLGDMPEGLSFTEQQKKIIAARVDGNSICELQKPELEKAQKDFILSITLICGFDAPVGLWDELKSLILNFGFENINLNELILAFRLNAVGMKIFGYEDLVRVEFSGKYLNINFFAKVLNNYMELRNSLDKKIKNSIDGL